MAQTFAVLKSLPRFGQMPSSAQLTLLISYLAAITGQNWRTRNNSVQLHSSTYKTNSSLANKTNSKQLNGLLTDKDKQPNIQRSMIKSLR